MKKYIIEVIIIIMILFMIFWAYVKFTVTKEVKVEPYQPYEPFGIVVDETTWNGKLEPGRYTKSGIKILEKHER
jgi:uncharacterized alpha/beta hydrolase family protein